MYLDWDKVQFECHNEDHYFLGILKGFNTRDHHINYFSCVNYIGGLGLQIGDYYEQIIKVAILNQLKGS